MASGIKLTVLPHTKLVNQYVSDKYHVLKVIQHNVVKVRSRTQPTEEFVIKYSEFDEDVYYNDTYGISLNKETSVMLYLQDSKLVPKIAHIIKDDYRSALVFEKSIGYVDLKEYAKSCLFNWSGCGNDSVISIIIENLIETIKKLNKLGIYHGDIKPANILINNNWNLLLIDFNICCVDKKRALTKEVIGEKPHIIHNEEWRKIISRNKGGTAGYSPMEALMRGPGIKYQMVKKQIYEIGATYFYLHEQCTPYKRETSRGSILFWNEPKVLSATQYQLVQNMMHSNESKRPGFDKALTDLKEINKPSKRCQII